MLTKIVAKKIMNSLSKYISIDMEKDFVVELWNGRLKMNKIEIRKQAAKNFKISGSIGNLDIKIPWSNIFSGFINVDVSDITIYISENTEVVHSQEILPESNLVVQEKKDGKMGFFERKILEKTLINIRNLKVKFKNYIFAIKNVILNEEKHLNMTDIESFTYHHTRKCKLLEKFSVNGKIIDNIVNIYTDCIKFNFFISNIQYHLSNFLPFRSFLVKDTNTSILTTGSNEKSEIKEFLDTESQNKIVDSDQKIKIRCAIDSIILNLYKDDNRLKTDHNNFKIHLSETFLDTTNGIKLVSKMESKHLSCDLLYDQTRFCAEKFYFNSSKFLKRLHNDFPVSSAIFLKKITFEKNILNLSHLILSLDKKKFKIPKAKLSLIKNVMSIKSIYDKTVHALKVHLLRRFFDFYQSLGIEPILKQFTSVQESPLQLAERFQIKISDVIIGNDFLFKNLEIAVFDILEESFKNEFDLKKLEVVNKEPKNNSDYKLNEKTETDILSIQDFSKTKIFVQKIIELSFDNASIFDNHYEHFRYSLNMNQLFPIEHINLNFIDIRNILENKDKERIFIESIKIPKCTIKGLSIDKDHLHIQNVNLIYDIDLVNSIYTIKTIIYSALGHKSKDTIAQKKEKVDFSIFLDNLTYFHRMLIEVSKLSFKNEILVLKCKSEGVEVDVKCDFSIENKNVITINITGYTDPEQYRLLIMTLVEFVSVLKEILDDPFEEKTPSNPLIFSTNCDLKIRDVVCNIQQHCNHGFYWFKTQVDTVIHGSEIKVTAKEAILEKLLFIEKQASHNFSEKGEPEVYDQLSKFFCQNEKSYVSTGNIAKVESVQCLIYDIPFGFNVSVHIPFLESTFGVHDFLVLKEKIITPKFDLIGTATNLYFKVQIDEIEAGNIHPELKKVKIIDFHLIQNKIKFDVTFDNISTIVVIKTDIGIANTVAISSNNIIIAKHLDFIDKYRNIVEFLIEEANTEFTPVKATQYNFVLKDTEIFLKRDPPIGQDILSEDVPFLRITIEKMIFFVPGTSSIKFYVDIFNPRRLGFDILIEPSTIIVTKHGEKFGILAETFNLSIQKETFKTFSIDPQEYLLYIENLMRDLSVFSKLKPIKYFEVNQNGTGSIFLQDTTANQSMFSEGTSSSQPAPFKPDDLSKIPGTQNVEIAPLCAVVSTKNTFSHRHTFSINGHPITLDMTQNSRIFFENSFIFMQIQNFTRNICFYKHIFFKNCLPYDLKLFIGNEDFQDEEIDLREECSFNTEFRFLRIGWREKRSADCFEFQKGIFKTHDNSDRQDAIKSLFKSKYDIMEKFILLAEKSIQINDRIINISSYVENVQGHFLYYVFFTPHSFIVNQTAKTHNIKLKNDYIEKTFSLDPEEIIVNDCFSLKNDLFLLRPSIGIKKNTSFEYRSSPQQTLDIEGSRAASNDDPIDFIISKEREKNVPDLQFSEKKLQIEIRGNAFPIVRVFVICPQFKINNLIDQNVTIDKVKIPKGTFEMPIDYGVVSIDSKTKIFDFNVLNILKEIDHKYIFSMEKEEISIDMGQKLNIVDVLNLTNPSNITYTQNIIEIDYSFLVRNETDIDLTVNGVSIGSSEEKFIAMKNKNVLKIGQQHIHLIKSPCFKHQDSFYTIITYIAKRRKIMRLCVSQAPIMIFNNLESIVCVNKKYFIQPFANLPFVHEDYEEFDIQFEFNHENKIRKIKRQLGRSFEVDGIQISSTQRGMREYIHVGKNNQNLSYTETLNFKIRKTIISLFEEEKEFLNIYVRDLNFCRKEDNLSKNCKIEMTVKGFQIDNQEHSPFFPIVLNPVFSQFYYYNTKSIENQYFIAFSCEFDPKLLASSRTNQKPEYSIIKDQESFNDINQKNVNENSKDQIKDQESFNDINQKNVNEN
ncbi:Vacuolar protein sorting-associated protein, partial [Pseudoloma neurophilia]